MFHCEYWMTAALDLADSCVSSERRAAAQSFALWVESAVAGGVREAHAWARRSEPWAPLLCSDPNTGELTSNTSVYLEKCRQDWSDIWWAGQECSADEVLEWDGLDSVISLPDIAVNDMRSTSAAFRCRTDNRDGFHPRHFS